MLKTEGTARVTLLGADGSTIWIDSLGRIATASVRDKEYKVATALALEFVAMVLWPTPQAAGTL